MSATVGDAIVDDFQNIWIAAGDGDLSSVQAFVESGVSVNAQDENGYTPLFVSRERAALDRFLRRSAFAAPRDDLTFRLPVPTLVPPRLADTPRARTAASTSCSGYFRRALTRRSATPTAIRR